MELTYTEKVKIAEAHLSCLTVQVEHMRSQIASKKWLTGIPMKEFEIKFVEGKLLMGELLLKEAKLELMKLMQ